MFNPRQPEINGIRRSAIGHGIIQNVYRGVPQSDDLAETNGRDGASGHVSAMFQQVRGAFRWGTRDIPPDMEGRAIATCVNDLPGIAACRNGIRSVDAGPACTRRARAAAEPTSITCGP
jgi:hypothetical protein